MERNKSFIQKFMLYVLLIIFTLSVGFLIGNFLNFNEDASVTKIEKSSSNGLVDTYTITYSNGTTSFFTVTNGANGEDAEKVSIEEIYNSAISSGVYSGSFNDFLLDYLSLEDNSSQTTNINKALLSSVSVYSEFPVITLEPVYTNTLFGYIQTGTQEVKNTQVGAGSGVIYSLDKANGNAYIITNYHVVYNKDCVNENKIGKINVFLYGYNTEVAFKRDADDNKVNNADGYPIVEYGDSSIECEYVGGSLNYDIAVLKISNSDILKNSSARSVDIAKDCSVGETAIAIGNPEAMGISVTSGILSVDSEYFQMYGADETTVVTFRTLRIDTAINSGNSGGGLFNSKGELIGIVNAKVISSDIENIAYAIPKDIAINVSDNLIYSYEIHNKHKINKVVVGLTLTTENTRAIWDESSQTTKIVEDIFVDKVNENSLADTLNFEVGDKILSVKINDIHALEPTRMFQVIDISLNFREGDSVVYNVERAGQTVVIGFTVTSDMLAEIE